jgi:hypothetical protein
MRRFPLLILAVATLLLTACTTITPEERRASDERSCAGYGFRPKTDGMARCLLDLDLDRKADLRSFRNRQDASMWSPVIVERPVCVRRY